jgi:tetratricopeptide (TPR) repeat protein
MKRSSGRLLCAAVLAAVAAVSAAAEEDLPVPAPRRGDVLQLPGLPPIQLPPGARAFGPRGPGVVDDDVDAAPSPRAPRAQERAPAARSPREAQKQPPPRQPPKSVMPVEERKAHVLDDLFKRLRDAGDVEEAKSVAGAIERVWLSSGSDTADLLMSRAAQALAMRDLKAAEKVLDSLVDIQPNWAEAWHKRATLRFFADDYAGAMSDIDRTLKLEPRHFGALAGLGAILQKSGSDKQALEVFRRSLDIYPEQPDLRQVVDKLKLEVEGRDI